VTLADMTRPALRAVDLRAIRARALPAPQGRQPADGRTRALPGRRIVETEGKHDDDIDSPTR
jgi:hypothetical protein